MDRIERNRVWRYGRAVGRPFWWLLRMSWVLLKRVCRVVCLVFVYSLLMAIAATGY